MPQLDPKLAEINRDILHGVLTGLTARKVWRENERLKLGEIQPIETEVALEPAAVQRQLQGQNEAFKSRRAVLEGR